MLKLKDFDLNATVISSDQMKAYFGGWLTPTTKEQNPYNDPRNPNQYYDRENWVNTSDDGHNIADKTGGDYTLTSPYVP